MSTTSVSFENNLAHLDNLWIKLSKMNKLLKNIMNLKRHESARPR